MPGTASPKKWKPTVQSYLVESLCHETRETRTLVCAWNGQQTRRGCQSEWAELGRFDVPRTSRNAYPSGTLSKILEIETSASKDSKDCDVCVERATNTTRVPRTAKAERVRLRGLPSPWTRLNQSYKPPRQFSTLLLTRSRTNCATAWRGPSQTHTRDSNRGTPLRCGSR